MIRRTSLCSQINEVGYRHSQRNGQGKLTYTDGSVYEGKWENGKFHGQGKLTRPDGRVYEGTWEDGMRNGKGTLCTQMEEFTKEVFR